MKGVLRTKYLKYHDSAKSLMNASNQYREEVQKVLERFRNLDFGSVTESELVNNTISLANEEGMLIGSYPSIFGRTDIIHNMNFGKTIVIFIHVVSKCSCYGFC